MKVNINPLHLGLLLLVIGVLLIVFGAYLAYNTYVSYTPILPRASSLEEAVTNTAYELVNVAVKLGFLGVLVWCGSIITKHGVSLVVEGYRVNKVSKCPGQ